MLCSHTHTYVHESGLIMRKRSISYLHAHAVPHWLYSYKDTAEIIAIALCAFSAKLLATQFN